MNFNNIKPELNNEDIKILDGQRYSRTQYSSRYLTAPLNKHQLPPFNPLLQPNETLNSQNHLLTRYTYDSEWKREMEEREEELAGGLERYREKMEVCEMQMREFVLTLAQCDRVLCAKNTVVAQLQKSLHDLLIVNNTLKLHNDEKDQELVLIKASAKEAEEKFRKLQEEQLKAINSERKELNGAIMQLRSSLEASNTECKRIKLDNEDLKQRLANAQSHKELNSNKKVMLSSRVETESIENTLRLIREEAQAKVKQEAGNAKVKELEQRCECLEEELESARQKLEEAEMSVEKSQDIICNYKELIDSINESKERLAAELENSEARVQRLLRASVTVQSFP